MVDPPARGRELVPARCKDEKPLGPSDTGGWNALPPLRTVYHLVRRRDLGTDPRV